MVALGSVAAIDRDSADPAALDPTTPYLGLEHIERGGRIIGSSTVGSAEVRSAKFRFDESHVLYGKLRPNLAKVSRPTITGVCSTDILPIRPGPALDRSFLTHYLLLPEMTEYAVTRTSGAHLPRLSPTTLAAFPVPLPSLPEQRRIAAILDKADEIRTKRREALAHLDTLPLAIFEQMFAESPGIVPPTCLGDVAEVQGGLQVSTKRVVLPVSVPYLRVANSYRGYLDLREVKTLQATEAEIARTRLKAGDLLLVEGHANPLEVGRVAMWDDELPTCVHQNHLIRARLDQTRCRPEFAAAWLNSSRGAAHFRRAGKTTSGLNTISAATVRSAPLPLPPLDLQREFAAKVTAIETHRTAVERALAADDDLFASLQSRAFRGEL